MKGEPTTNSGNLGNLLGGPCDNLVNSNTLKIKINQEAVLKGCVELVTVNGCPFEMLEYSGFKRILNPIFAMIGNNFGVNSSNIRRIIPETALKIITHISKTLRKKMISLKIDVVTRLHKSILMVSAQLILEGQINLFTLGMTELENKINVKNIIEKILKKYQISVQQIYSVITDDGCDMIKFKNFKKLPVTETEEEYLVTKIENDIKIFDNNTIFDSSNFPFNKLVGIKSVTHAMEVAFKDSIKNANLNELISDAKNLVKKLRNPSLLMKVKDLNNILPVLDCADTWSSTYIMLKKLLKCKNVILSLAEKNIDYSFEENKWIKLSLVVESLKPLVKASLKLQSKQLTLSDVFGVWVQCKIQLRTLKNIVSEILFNQLSNTESILLESDSMLGAVFLDPRYQILLKSSQKIRAVQHLKEIWNKLKILLKPLSDTNKIPQDCIKSTNLDELSNEADELHTEPSADNLKSFNKSTGSSVLKNKCNSFFEVNIESILNGFDHVERKDKKINILEFWEKNRSKHPHLYKIAMVVFSAPATRISVERAFSGLKFILLENKNSLNESSLEDVLIIRSNFHLF